MEHTKHIWRAVLILVALSLAGIVVRHFLVPASFGEEGFYRYDSLAEFMEKPIVHGSPTACQECHLDQYEARAEGKHSTVTCESCHAPVTSHALDEEKVAEMRINRSHTLCANCHQTLIARPESMPQVDVPSHLVDMELIAKGDAIPEGVCLGCHDVHDPSL